MAEAIDIRITYWLLDINMLVAVSIGVQSDHQLEVIVKEVTYLADTCFPGSSEDFDFLLGGSTLDE